ncbi:FAD:protein FMN transferase [Verrucomicrobiota bacterium]
MKKLIFLLILSPLFSAGCSPEKAPAKETWLAMGTFANVSVGGHEQKNLKMYASVAKDTFCQFENMLSVYDPESEISRLNKSAGRSPVAVSPLTREVLQLAVKYSDISSGCFDPTVAPLVRLWGFHDGTVPDKPLGRPVIDDVLVPFGYKHVVISEHTAYLDTRGMEVDLGGIAKGYAVDVCYRRLEKMNAENIMINLGGNIRCRGLSRKGKPWRIGVKNPFEQSQIIGIITLSKGMSVATSGHYERFVTIEGKRYAHIIDPRTGYPAEGVAGVTVICNNAVEADAMSTALFILGPKEAFDLLKKMPKCHVMFILDKQPCKALITQGFSQYFKPLNSFRDNIEIIAE